MFLKAARVLWIPPVKDVNVGGRVYVDGSSAWQDRLAGTNGGRVEDKFQLVSSHLMPNAHERLDQDLAHDLRKQDVAWRDHLKNDVLHFGVVKDIYFAPQWINSTLGITTGENRTTVRVSALKLEIEVPRLLDLLIPHTDAARALEAIRVVLKRSHAAQTILEWQIKVEERTDNAAFQAMNPF